MECPNCRADVGEGRRFCTECGTPFAAGCLSCGSLNPAGAKFCGECGARLGPDPATTPLASAPPTAPPAASAAERRQLTVMFCDLVGSTALASRLDPEDLREVIGAYHSRVAETVAGFDGFVAKYMGDGVLVYFGYPQAHEDDAERAVRAGLALIGAGAQEAARPHIRIGIGTGQVVVGDLLGHGEAQERGVVGETPNLAARLQALAVPDSLVIDSHTRRLVGDLFEYRELGATALKGFPGPVRAYQVLRPSAVESRFEAFHSLALTPLVGRDEEIDLLRRRWQRAKGGAGQVVLLSGEPGIGKSRLTAAILEQTQGEAHTRLRYFCSPYHTDSALYPVITQFERAAGFDRADTADTRLDKLEALLVPTGLSKKDFGLLADLVSATPPDDVTQPDLSPQLKKEKTLEAVLSHIELLAHRQPVLMVAEDAHWIDPTSRELLDLAIDRIRHLPVLLLIAFRPEFHPPWLGQAHVTMLALNRLGPDENEALVGQVLGGRSLPDKVIAEIVKRTDGIPLFVEELTKAVLEDAGNSNTSRILSPASVLGLAVPSTLNASLMARLDRLGPIAKEVAQIGAAIDREFSYEVLRAVWQGTDPDLRAALGKLVQAGLVFCRGLPPQANYVFKHALVQDASYGTLLRGRRQELHSRIVAVLERHFPDTAEQQPELLAHHCARAGLMEQAIAYWGQAGRQSLARSAMTEAVAKLHKGLELLPKLSDGPERWRRELELQSALGAALVASLGNPAPETGRAYARARELGERLGDTAALVPVLSGLSTYYQTSGDYAAMREISEELLCLGRQHGDAASSLVGHRSMALYLYQLGDITSAQEHFERVLSLYTPEAHQGLASLAAFDMRAVALSYLPLVFFALGYPDRASATSRQALAWSRSLRHPHNLAFSLNYAAAFHLIGQAAPTARPLLGELIALTTEHRFPVWLASAQVMQGYLMAAGGEGAEGLVLARKGVAGRAATGAKWHQTYFTGLLAQVCERAGRIDEALELLTMALEAAASTGERWFLSELHRLRGEWLLAHRRGQEAEAEESFDASLAFARQQLAKSWELRTTASLARLWRDQGRRAEARALLTPAYDWFVEGLATSELRQTRALLDDLSDPARQ